MTDTAQKTDAAWKKDEKYNIIGTATNIVVVETATGRFARLTIDRGAKGLLSAKLKDGALAKFEAAGFGEGSSVDFFGYFQKSTWTGQDGKLRTSKTFEVVSVSTPKTPEEIAALRAAKAARMGDEALAAQAPVVQAPAMTGDEIPF
jgi:hypothetical protein